jgi:hypothetical protein
MSIFSSNSSGKKNIYYIKYIYIYREIIFVKRHPKLFFVCLDNSLIFAVHTFRIWFESGLSVESGNPFLF